jgi:hypothetical protein
LDPGISSNSSSKVLQFLEEPERPFSDRLNLLLVRQTSQRRQVQLHAKYFPLALDHFVNLPVRL